VCLIIAFIAAAFAVAAFNAGNTLIGLSSVAISLFFAGLMIRNIIQVRKRRETKGEER
jgi:low affinity Fe/Cu permease